VQPRVEWKGWLPGASGPVIVCEAHAGGLLAEADRLAQPLAREGILLTRVNIGPHLQPGTQIQIKKNMKKMKNFCSI